MYISTKGDKGTLETETSMHNTLDTHMLITKSDLLQPNVLKKKKKVLC